jgi:integrase
MGIKNQKGVVSIENYRDRIRLRWRVMGKRFTLSTSIYNDVNLLAARKLAMVIEQDIALGHFDATLVRYTGKVKSTPSPKPMGFVELFEYWVKNFKQMDCEVHTNYNSTRNILRKWGRVDSSNIVKKVNSTTNAAVTYNRRLTILKSFCDWLVAQKYWEHNPLNAIQRKKVKQPKLSKREPLTEDEIRRILEAFRTNSACSPHVRYRHDFYYPFIYFIFKTGVRNAEAVGLRVKSVDLQLNRIFIQEVLARSLKSTSSCNRVRKATKNEKERVLPLTPDLREVLLPLLHGKEQDQLVFLSPKGKAIDDKNFRERVFKPILSHLRIPERVLYAARHTFGSRCIDQGITPVMTAFLMGNNPETALKRYTHQLNIPDDLPSI